MSALATPAKVHVLSRTPRFQVSHSLLVEVSKALFRENSQNVEGVEVCLEL